MEKIETEIAEYVDGNGFLELLAEFLLLLVVELEDLELALYIQVSVLEEFKVVKAFDLFDVELDIFDDLGNELNFH